MTFSPTLACIPFHSHHHTRHNAVPSEANRYQLVLLERLLQDI